MGINTFESILIHAKPRKNQHGYLNGISNIAKENKELVDELNGELLEWLTNTDDPWLEK